MKRWVGVALVACSACRGGATAREGPPVHETARVELPEVAMGTIFVATEAGRAGRVQAAFDARNEAVRACFRSAPPPVPTEADVTVTVVGGGGAASVTVGASGSAIAACLEHALRSVAVGEPLIVHRTFRFVPVEGTKLLELPAPLVVHNVRARVASRTADPTPPPLLARAPEPLGADEVRDAIAEQRSLLQSCYESVLRRQSGAKGPVTFTMTINWDGSAAEGGIVTANDPPAAFVREAVCFASALDSLRFRAVGVNTPVRLRVTFDPTPE